VTRRDPVIAVVGPGEEATDAQLTAAERVGSLFALAGHQVLTGGLGGVMAAASRGARAAGGSVIALLPGDDASTANPDADVVIATGLGEGRNAVVVRSAAVVVAIGGSWGTLSEVALARRMGRPVVWLHGWAVDGADDPVPTAATAEEAVAFALSSLP
jgi:uncharacterized protein (TIGR00725 family)